MIRFACRCSQVLELPDDMAGLTAQCPRCGLLVDVPALSDLGAIEKDGTYRLDDKPKPKADEHLKELTTIYYPGRQLPDGSEIDLRGPVQPPEPEPAPAPTSAPSPSPAGPPEAEIQPERPKYDPETGELIAPIEIAQDVPKPVHPSTLPTARRVISYNTSAEHLPQTLGGLGVFARLFQPVNVAVMGVVLLMHMGLVLLAVVSNFVVFIILAPVFLLLILVGHYAMVVEEMGPGDRDELPRPLRNVHLYDDFLAPFLHMVWSLLLCYWPSLLVMLINFVAWAHEQPFPFPRTRELHLALLVLGSLLFPAVLQTICTSGNIVNLRPDRLLGLIRVMGLRYPGIVLLWMVASVAAVGGQMAVLLNWVSMLGWPNPPLIAKSYVAYPLLMTGVYLLHAFGWILGLEYRRGHSHYPWALQEHIRTLEKVQAPTLHPKLSAAEQAAQERAAKRTKFQVR